MFKLPFFITILLLTRGFVCYEICHDLKPKITCELDVITSINQQQKIMSNLCISKDSIKESQLVPTVQKLHVDIGLSLHSHCTGRTQGFLKWVTQPFFESTIKFKLANIYITNFVSRFDAATNGTEILIEVLPNHYVLKNCQLNSSKNVQHVRDVDLGSTQLYNTGHTSQSTNGSIAFGYQTRVNVRLINENAISGLSVSTSNATTYIGDFVYGHPHFEEHKEIYNIVKLLPARSNVNVTLKGTWTIFEYEIIGTLIKVFDTNINESKHVHEKNVTAKVTQTRVTHIRHIYSSNTDTKKEATFFQRPDIMDSRVYPGFSPYFYVACIILFSTILVVFLDVSRKILNDKTISSTNFEKENGLL